MIPIYCYFGGALNPDLKGRSEGDFIPSFKILFPFLWSFLFYFIFLIRARIYFLIFKSTKTAHIFLAKVAEKSVKSFSGQPDLLSAWLLPVCELQSAVEEVCWEQSSLFLPVNS